MAAEDVDTSREVVKTYVPAYQKSEWQEHADDLDMTQSEFVRTMVQAGRRGFLDETAVEPEESDGAAALETSGDGAEQTASTDADNTDLDIDDRAFHIIAEEEPVDWDDLHRELVGDIEAQLDNSLQALQAENKITYSGRQGGYVVVDEDAR